MDGVRYLLDLAILLFTAKLFSICFVLISLLSKIIGCGGCAKVMGFNGRDSMKIGIGMMTRGEVSLISAQMGLSAGLLTSDFFISVILLILVSSIVSPVLLKQVYAAEAAHK